jgi:hypothetical protein
MKFLTFSSYKDSYFALPQTERNKFGISSVQWILDLKVKMGGKFRFFSSPGSNRYMSLSEFDTLEDYAQSLQTPAAAAGFIKYESRPLIEGDEKTLKQMLARLKSAK